MTRVLAPLIALLSPLSANYGRSADKESAPNIVFILADDKDGYLDRLPQTSPKNEPSTEFS
jgi:hypothetical protein